MKSVKHCGHLSVYITEIIALWLVYFFSFFFLILKTVSFFFFLFVVNFVIHWNESAMGLHVFPIQIPPPTPLSTRSL